MASSLRQIPKRPEGHPATADEQVVNEKIFGECNHRDWTEFVDRDETLILACSGCGGEFRIGHREEIDHFSRQDQDEYLLTAIRKYADLDVLANLTLREVEAAGWRPLVEQAPGRFVCSLAKDGHRFTSASHTARSQAVCEAAAKLGKSGLFIPKR